MLPIQALFWIVVIVGPILFVVVITLIVVRRQRAAERRWRMTHTASGTPLVPPHQGGTGLGEATDRKLRRR